MTDLLTAHATGQPDPLLVIDDRGHGNIRMLIDAELRARSSRLAHVLLELGVSPGQDVVWCGQSSHVIVETVDASRTIGTTAVGNV